MRNQWKILLTVFIAILVVAGCGKNDNEPEKSENNSAEKQETENEQENNVENDAAQNESEEAGLAEGKIDLTEAIDDLLAFYDRLTFSDAAFLDFSDGFRESRVTLYTKDNRYAATLAAHTVEPQSTMTVNIEENNETFAKNIEETNVNGENMAKEVADGAYEFADSLIWQEDDLYYRLSGGRRVVSNVEANIMNPEDDRLEFYNHLAGTNKEFDEDEAFYRGVITPTVYPSDYELSAVELQKENVEVMGMAYPTKIRYRLEASRTESMVFHVISKYKDTPVLFGKGVEEREINGVVVQTRDDIVSFTLGEETYRINYEGISLEEVYEVAESIIEQYE